MYMDYVVHLTFYVHIIILVIVQLFMHMHYFENVLYTVGPHLSKLSGPGFVCNFEFSI